MKYSSLLLLFFSFLTSALYSQTFPTEWIIQNGDVSSKVNYVFMGDGYRASEQNKFLRDVRNTVDAMFKEEPFASNKENFNIAAIKVPSNVSGAARSPNRLIDNYFGSTYNYADIERLLVAVRDTRINNVLATNFPWYDQVIIVVNDDKYGGSGGQHAVYSTNQHAFDIALHEIGHSYAQLADEYWHSGYEAPNQTMNSNRQTVKWKQFIGQKGVGVYAHAAPNQNWYVPHQGCKMRELGKDFCLVCQNEITKKTRSLSNAVTLTVPTGLSSYNVRSTSFSWSWSAVNRATAYEIQLWNGEQWIDKGTTTETFINHSGFHAGSTQYVRVRSKQGNTVSNWSDYLTVVLQEQNSSTLSIPSNLRTSAVRSYGFYAVWNQVTAATRYEVQTWVNGAWASAGISSTTHLWIRATAGSTQYFRVRAYNQNATSDFSNWVAITLPLSPPTQPDNLEKPLTTTSYLLYPNPSYSSFKVDALSQESIHITIINSSGAIIREVNTFPSQSVDISSLAADSYIIIIRLQDGQLIHKKLVKI